MPSWTGCVRNWQSAASLPWPFPALKYKYIFQIKYTEAILSNSSRKRLWFEISKMMIVVLRSKFIVLIYYNFRRTFVGYSRCGGVTRDNAVASSGSAGAGLGTPLNNAEPTLVTHTHTQDNRG